MPDYRAKALLCDTAKFLSARGLLGLGQGNLSIRTGRFEFWVTPRDIHPALLTGDQLMRVNTGGRVYGRREVDEHVLNHHLRIYRQIDEAGIVLALAPAYIDLLREQKRFPEYVGEAVSSACPLCDAAKAGRGFIHEAFLILWGNDIGQVLAHLDEVELEIHTQLYKQYRIPEPDTVEDTIETMDKQTVMRLVTDRILAQVRGG